ncbi:protein PLANT CADMIUM RESISTANCE 2-like [Silene latifolia]|uniref:protein PLANT CADMIUM RESISTANCE 2-like n=1 Tax=Silene latifolia TaxID=37657 RepID=UPI003D779B31
MHPSQDPVPSAPTRPSAPFTEPSFRLSETGEEVHTSQPPPPLPPTDTFRVSESVEWNTGLCEWYSDIPNCCITCFCPCITFGEFSEIVDRGASSCPINGLVYAMLLAVFGCACMYSFFYRVRMRQQYNLKGSRCGDCCIHLWCEMCALCQEHRELKLRGFNMHSGWYANAENQTDGAMIAPAMHTGMRR